MKKKKNLLCLLFLMSTSFCFSEDLERIVYTTNNENIYDICFSADGQALAITDGNIIRVCASDKDSLLYELKGGHTERIVSVDFSNNGKVLVSGGRDSSVVIWDLTSRKRLRTLKYHKGIVTTLKISSDGKYLISGGTDHKVFLYDLIRNELIHEFPENENDVLTVTFSPDSKQIAMAGARQPIRIYNTSDYSLLASFGGHSQWISSICYNTYQNKLYACGYERGRTIWDISDLVNIKKISTILNKSWTLSSDFLENDYCLALGFLSGKLLVYTPTDGFTGEVRSPIRSVKIQPSNNLDHPVRIAVATKNKGVQIISATSMKSFKVDDFLVKTKDSTLITKGDIMAYRMIVSQRLKEGSAILDNAIRLNKEHSESFALKADILFRKNRMDSALLIAESGLKVNPTSYKLLGFSAIIYDNKGDSARASYFYRRALVELEHSHLALRSNLDRQNYSLNHAILLLYSGKTDQAAEAISLYKKSYPLDDSIDEFQQRSKLVFIPLLLEGLRLREEGNNYE